MANELERLSAEELAEFQRAIWLSANARFFLADLASGWTEPPALYHVDGEAIHILECLGLITYSGPVADLIYFRAGPRRDELDRLVGLWT